MTRSLIVCATLLFASLARADTEETFGIPIPTRSDKVEAVESTETFGIPVPTTRADKFMGEIRHEVLAQQGACIDGQCATPMQFVNPVQQQQTFGVVQQAIAAPAPVVVQQPVAVQQAAPAERVVAQIVERTRYEEVVEQREVIVRRPVKELVEVPVPQYQQQAAPCPCPQPVYYQQQCAQPVYYQQQQAYYQQQYFQQQYRQAPRQQRQQLSGTAQHLMGPPHYFTYEQVAGRQEWELEQMHTQHHAELDARGGGGRAFANGNGPVRRFAGRIRERFRGRRGG